MTMKINNEDRGSKIVLNGGEVGTFIKKIIPPHVKGSKSSHPTYVVNLKDGGQVAVYESHIAEFHKGVPGWK